MKLVKCFNFNKCHNTVRVDESPANWAGLKMITPQVDQAVWICDSCRPKPKLLKSARELMFKKLGWKESGRSHASTDEL